MPLHKTEVQPISNHPPGRASDASSASASAFAETAPVPKKARTQRSQTTTHTLSSLLALPHQDEYALSLQNSAPQSNGSTTVASSDVWTEEKIAERAVRTRNICITEIKKQMKWQPSCKTGKTKWSYTGMVPHEDVSYKLFRFEQPKKAWKVKKIPMGDFYQIFGSIDASVRYNTLSITGEEVRLNWDGEEETFKLAGTYGL